MSEVRSVTGRSRISGHETLSPTPRQISVARAYVNGLERKSAAYEVLQVDFIQLSEDSLALAAHNLLLRRILREFVDTQTGLHIDEELAEQLETLLADTGEVVAKFWNCPCGHSSFDHDEEGCSYLGCKAICGS